MADALATLGITVDAAEVKKAIDEIMGEDIALAKTVKDAAKAYGEAVYEARARGLTITIDLVALDRKELTRETAFAKTTISREL